MNVFNQKTDNGSLTFRGNNCGILTSLYECILGNPPNNWNLLRALCSLKTKWLTKGPSVPNVDTAGKRV